MRKDNSFYIIQDKMHVFLTLFQGIFGDFLHFSKIFFVLLLTLCTIIGLQQEVETICHESLYVRTKKFYSGGGNPCNKSLPLLSNMMNVATKTHYEQRQGTSV